MSVGSGLEFTPKTAAPDWGALQGVDLDAVLGGDADAQERLEQIGEQLLQWRVSDDATPEQLSRAFTAAQLLFEMRDVDSKDLETEFRDMQARYQQLQASHVELQDRHEKQTRELDELEQYMGDMQRGRDAYGDNDIDVLRAQLRKAEDDLVEVQRTAEVYQSELRAQQMETERLKELLRERDANNLELTDKVDSYDAQVKELQRQLRLAASTLESRAKMENANSATVRERNRRVQQLQEEVTSLQADHDELVTKAMDAQRLYEDQLALTDRLQVQLNEAQNLLQEHDVQIEHLERDRANLLARVQVFELRLSDRGEADNALVRAVEAQVKELQHILDDKNDKQRELEREMAELRGENARLQTEVSHDSNVALRAQLAERNDEIALLRQQLEDKSVESDAMAAQVLQLRRETRAAVEVAVAAYKKQFEALRERALAVQDMLEGQQERNDVLFEQNEALQAEIIKTKNRMIEYEKGTYGLEEAVGEIRELERRVGLRDADIMRLNTELNERLRQVQRLFEENQALRIRAGLTEEEVIDLRELRLAQYTELQTLRLQRVALEEENTVLEDDRIKLHQQLIVFTKLLGQRAAELGINAEHLLLANRQGWPDLEGRRRRGDGGAGSGAGGDGDDDGAGPGSGAIVSSRREIDSATVTRLREELSVISSQVGRSMDLERQIGRLTGELNEVRQQRDDALQSAQELRTQLERVAGRAGLDDAAASAAAAAAAAEAAARAEAARASARAAALADTDYTSQPAAQRRIRALEDELGDVRGELKARDEEVTALRDRTLAQAGEVERLQQVAKFGDTTSLLKHLQACLMALAERDDRLVELTDAYGRMKRRVDEVAGAHLRERQEHANVVQALNDKIGALNDQVTELQRQADDVRDKAIMKLPSTEQELGRTLTRVRLNERISARKAAHADRQASQAREQYDFSRELLFESQANYLKAAGSKLGLAFASRLCWRLTELELTGSQPAIVYDSLRGKMLHARAMLSTSLKREQDWLRQLLEMAHAPQLVQLQAQVGRLEDELALMRGERDAMQQLLANSSELDRDVATLTVRAETAERRLLNAKEHHGAVQASNERLAAQLQQVEEQLAAATQQLSAANHRVVELEEELERHFVPRAQYDDMQQRLLQMKKDAALLVDEKERLRAAADVAESQTQTVLLRKELYQTEIETLRQTVADMQSRGEHETTLGRVSHELLQQRLKATDLARTCERLRRELSGANAEVVRLEQLLSDGDSAQLRERRALRRLLAAAEKRALDAEERLAGSVTLEELQQRSGLAMVLTHPLHELISSRAQLQEQLEGMRYQVTELEARVSMQQTTIGMLEKHDTGAATLARLSEELTEQRLLVMRRERDLFVVSAAEKHHREVVQKLSDQLSDLEARLLGHESRRNREEQTYEHEVRRLREQLDTQQREMLMSMEASEAGAPGAKMASRTQELSKLLTQAQHALTEERTAGLRLKSELADSERKRQQAESLAAQRELAVKELRSRLDSVAEGLGGIDALSASADGAAGSLRAAMLARHTVQAKDELLARKDQELAEYKRMLDDTRAQLRDMAARHTADMERATAAAQGTGDAAERGLAESEAASHAMVVRQLNDAVGERDAMLAELRAELNVARAELHHLRGERGDEVVRLHALQQRVDDSTVPSRELHAVVAQLQATLAKKENEQERLRKVIAKLREDMLSDMQRGGNVGPGVPSARAEQVQRALDAKQAQLEELAAKLKRHKAHEAQLAATCEEQKAHIAALTTQLVEAKAAMRSAGAAGASVDSSADADTALGRVQLELAQTQLALAETRRQLREHEDAAARRGNAQRRPSTAAGAGTATAPAAVAASAAPTAAASSAATGATAERWEAEKRAQKALERVKKQLQERTDELATATKTLVDVRGQLEQTQRECERLRAEVADVAANPHRHMPREMLDELRALRKRVFDLEEEKARVERVVLVEKDIELRRARQQRDQLAARTQQLERDAAASHVIGPTELEERAEQAQRQLEAMQTELLESDNAKVELRFDKQRLMLQVERLQARIEDQNAYIEALQGGRPVAGGARPASASAAAVSAPGAAGSKPGAREREIAELRDTVEALRKTLQKVQSEKLSLQRNAASSKIVETSKENRTLKKRVAELEEQLSAAQKGVNTTEDTERRVQRVALENDKFKRQLRKAVSDLEEAQSALAAAEAERDALRAQVLGSADIALPTPQDVLALRGQIQELQVENRKLASQLADAQQRSAEHESTANDLRAQLQETVRAAAVTRQQLDAANRMAAAVEKGDVASEIQRENRALKQRLSELQAEKAVLDKRVNAMRASVGDSGEFASGRSYAALVEAHERLQQENSALLRELRGFDAEFFEELEDLKFNYRESVRRCEAFETELRRVCKQFGVDYHPPPGAAARSSASAGAPAAARAAAR